MASKLPPSLNLPPHLSAHKYFFVCTLTVAAWDTLVLSPREWRVFKSPGWPPLKILFHFMRWFMPIEFTIVGVAFFDTAWTQEMCRKFYLFEPIATAVLLAAASAVHVIRIHAIYEKDRRVLLGLCALYAAQIITTAVACGFYRAVPLDVGQGCISGPKANWVGIYWVMPTILYVTTLILALNRSRRSLKSKPLSLWKLMLRDGLNLYGTIALVNLVNMFFWFIVKPKDKSDPIKTIVTSMAAVLTTSMTLRIILSVRGPLASGGSFAGSSTNSSSSRATHVLSSAIGRSGGQNGLNGVAQTITLDEMPTSGQVKPNDWYHESGDADGKSSLKGEEIVNMGKDGIKITVDREVEIDANLYSRK